MYPITNAVKALFEAEQRKVLRITGTDKNGTSITITDDNVIADSFQIDRYSCNGEKLEVGTAIAAQLSFTLENGSGLYNSIVFEGAELFVEVGIADWTQSSPTVTYVPCGYFTPDNQPRRLSTISIMALDRMTLFDAVVDAADLTFPTTVAGLVGQVCTACGVTLAQSISGLVNAGVSVAKMPMAQGDITYRNLIQWCAGIMGTNAWFDWNGQLRFSWYANATGYVSTTDNRYNSDMYEDDLTVSGVEYTNDSGIVIVEGTDDYAIDLTGNAIAGPLVATVLPALNTALNGFTYRPFTAATVNAPYLWPMDVVTFTDKDGNDHTSALTNVAFGLNGTTAMESKGMTYAVNKLAQPKGFTREQAQLVSQAMEHVEKDIDDSLTQQEIFNRLTDDGAAQGLVLYNGQLYINASYINAGYLNANRISGGTIDGGTVNAKLLNIVDANGNVIASFNNVITLGKATDAHVEMDSNSFEIYSENRNMLCFIGDERDANGHANLRDTFEGTGFTQQFYLSRRAYSVSSVKINDIATSAYTLINDNLQIEFNTAPADGATIEMIYTTVQPVMRYDIGKRADMSYVGPYSVVLGNGNTASGVNSVAQGSSTIASGNASHAEGTLCEATEYCSHAEGNDTKANGQSSHAEGYGTIAASYAQHVAGQFNVKDGNDTYAEIIGNGDSDSTRSNARTLDWNGNEWIAGALNVGDAATTRTNLGITPANIGAVAKSGDEMTGALTVNGDAVGIFLYGVSTGNPGMIIKNPDADIAAIYGLQSDHHILFRSYIPGTNSGESYSLPAPTTGDDYQILTTKNPVRAADINVMRVAKDSRNLPGYRAFRVEEYTAGANYDLPTNDWYFILSMQGEDTHYGAQLALGMTTTGAYYRPYIADTWGAWQPLINVKPSVHDVTATTDANGNISLDLNQQNYVVTAVKVPSLIATPWVSGGDNSWHARITGINGNPVASQFVTATVYYHAV